MLLNLWEEARRRGGDAIAAWDSLQASPELRRAWQRTRGKGGLRPVEWEVGIEIVAAAMASALLRGGADRLAGFLPRSFPPSDAAASVSRLIQLLGGTCLSEETTRPECLEIWGEPAPRPGRALLDARLVVVHGSSGPSRRPEDWQWLTAARHGGTRLFVASPEFGRAARHADEWIGLRDGGESAFWTSAVHVLLRELHAEQQAPALLDYVHRFTDAPLLVRLDRLGPESEAWRAGPLLRAESLASGSPASATMSGFLGWDAASGPRVIGGTGRLGADRPGITPPRAEDRPTLSFIDSAEAVLRVQLDASRRAPVPVRFVETTAGRTAVTTVYDLLFARYGVGRGLEGTGSADYDDAYAFGTPAWQERRTGVPAEQLLRFARELGRTALASSGRCAVVVEDDQRSYRHAIVALMLTGCIGPRRGAFADWSAAPAARASSPLPAFAEDWRGAPRLQDAGSWIYLNAGHWRREVLPNPEPPPVDLPRTPAGERPDSSPHRATGFGNQALVELDAPRDWPRICVFWENSGESALQDERFLRAGLGTDGLAELLPSEREAPRGKLDLVLSLDGRVGAGPVFSDVVLPCDGLPVSPRPAVGDGADPRPDSPSDSQRKPAEVLAALASRIDALVAALPHSPADGDLGRLAERLTTRGPERTDELLQRDREPGEVDPVSADDERGPLVAALDPAGRATDLAPGSNAAPDETLEVNPAGRRGSVATPCAAAFATPCATAFATPCATACATPRATACATPCATAFACPCAPTRERCPSLHDSESPWPTPTGRQQFHPEPPEAALEPSPDARADFVGAQAPPSDSFELIVRPGPPPLEEPGFDENTAAWLAEADGRRLGIADGDWVEITNVNGAVCTRARLTARVPNGVCLVYERNTGLVEVPRAPSREGRRAGAARGLLRLAWEPPRALEPGGTPRWPPRRLTTLVADRVSVRRLGEPRF